MNFAMIHLATVSRFVSVRLGRKLAALLVVALTIPVHAQQIPDTSFTFTPEPPAYTPGGGPLILIDGAHHNFHTVDKRFRPFALLAERDGFRVSSNDRPFTAETLADADILVIANANSAENEQNWTLPAYPAFTGEEIAAVEAWVEQGGALLLIADHMPFPGAAEGLAQAFGFHFVNGFAASDPDNPGADVFRAGDGLSTAHPIAGHLAAEESTAAADSSKRHLAGEGFTAAADSSAELMANDNHTRDYAGRYARIDSVRSFTGQAFLADDRAVPLLRFPDGAAVLLPDTAWVFDSLTTRLDASGWLQGATREYGSGRVAVFGEAAMFTAQLAGPERRSTGFNHPSAPQNAPFVLNVLRWLAEHSGNE